MAARFVKNQSFVCAGLSIRATGTTSCDSGLGTEVSVPAGKAGTLTTRTDNDTGTVTMSSGSHGVLTGDKVDIYWTDAGVKKQRRGMTVGTVSGTSVPIDGGTGDDNLPTTSTALVVSVIVEKELAFNETSVVGFGMGTNKQGTIAIMDGSTEDFNVHFQNSAGGMYTWEEENGIDYPITVSGTKVRFSNANTTSAATMQIALGISQ